MPHLKTLLCIMTLGTAALVGCQRYTNVPRGELKSTPLDVDEAMEIRDWEPMSARYTNPRFIAGPTGFWFQPAYDMPAPVYAVQETPMFVLQALALPVTMWFPPPWTPVEYAGETVEPTWHALPPEPASRYGEPAGPAEVTERGTDEPPPEPMPLTPAPYEETPGTMPMQSTQPAAAPRAATPAPEPARPARPATQPAVQYTPSSVAPTRTAPATRPTTGTRELTK